MCPERHPEGPGPNQRHLVRGQRAQALSALEPEDASHYDSWYLLWLKPKWHQQGFGCLFKRVCLYCCGIVASSCVDMSCVHLLWCLAFANLSENSLH